MYYEAKLMEVGDEHFPVTGEISSDLTGPRYAGQVLAHGLRLEDTVGSRLCSECRSGTTRAT